MVNRIAFLAELNAFETYDDTRRNQDERRLQIRATRVYILLVTVSLINLTLALSLTKSTVQGTLNDPTIDQVANLPIDGQCPCSRLAIPYETFVTLGIDLHPVCSSDFVTDRWIEAVFPGVNANWLYQGDFRLSASAQFLLLRSLCQLSERHFQDNAWDFYATTLISPRALSRSVLLRTLKSSIAQFQTSLPFTFQTQLNLINQMIFANKWLNGLQTTMRPIYLNYGIESYSISPIWFFYKDPDYLGCLCLRNYTCKLNTAIYEPSVRAYDTIVIDSDWDRQLFSIPNFYIGCMLSNTLLLSSLECFYNQTCLDRIVSQIDTDQTFTTIGSDNESRFAIHDTLQTIVDALMITNWTEHISYESYFQQCAPRYCVYSMSQGRSALAIVTEVIGLLGGVTLVIRTAILISLRLAEQRRNNHQPPVPAVPRTSRLKFFRTVIFFCSILVKNRISQWIGGAKKSLMEINHFERRGLARGLVRHQIVGTRIYLVILLVSGIILSMYTFFTEDDQRQTVFNPTEWTYTALLQTHQASLTCPCAQVSIPNDQFIFLEPVYHHICSSSFVSAEWLNYSSALVKQFGFSDGIPFDIGVPFQFTAILCDYSKESIKEALKLFFRNQLVTFQVNSPSLFSLQIQATIDTWISDTINQFQLQIDLIRAISEGNKYLNSFANFQFSSDETTGAVDLMPSTYGNCSCDQSQSCSENVHIKQIRVVLPEQSNDSIIDDFYTGCSNFESLAQSSFGCFYNQTCLDAIKHQLNETMNIRSIAFDYEMTAMNSSGLGVNATHELFAAALDRLMVSQWKSNVSFSAYYTACAPSFCAFAYRSRRSMMVICMTVVSVIGGLSTATAILMLLLIRTMEKILQHEQRPTVQRFIVGLFHFGTEQQIINRVHFIIMVFLLIVFYFVSFLPSRQITVEVSQPSFSTYQTLLKEHGSQWLECSCAKLAISYESFLSIQPRFHEICSSAFVSGEWLKHTYTKTRPFRQFDQSDFYRTAYAQYQLLAAFCQLARKTVMNGLVELNKTSYTSGQLLTSEGLHQEAETVLDRFQNRTPRLFGRLMNLVREVTEGNMLMTLYATNWKMQDLLLPITLTDIATEPVSYDSCSCGSSTKCTTSSANVTVGCYPLEALLHSTLHCFYHQPCIDADGFFPALNCSEGNSRFNLSVTVEELLQDLMVEEYGMAWSYENYFTECSVTSCSYSYQGRQNTVDIVTSLVGLYGGLMIISEWVALLSVRWYLYRRRNRIGHSQ